MEFYLRQNYPNSFKVEKDEGGNIKQSDIDKITNLTSNRFATIEHFLNKKDFETARDFIEQYRAALTSDDFKYAEQMDGEDMAGILNLLDIYERVANGEITLEEIQNIKEGNAPNTEKAKTKETPANTNSQSVWIPPMARNWQNPSGVKLSW